MLTKEYYKLIYLLYGSCLMPININQTNLKISVILSTFNRPRALQVVLESLCRQDDRGFEVIVADDGSDESTKAIVLAMAKAHPTMRIKHVWQPKLGFRLARIRNLAVKQSSGDYLIFLDGDCVVPVNFIFQHRKLSEEGWAVYGQRILASKKYTESIEADSSQIARTTFWTFGNFLRLRMLGNVNRFFPTLTILGNSWRKRSPHSWQHVRGCNWALWRKDYIQINGSDESFEGWGSEDKDVAVRLINAGINLKSGKCGSYVLHLWHSKATRDKSNFNYSLVEDRIKNREIYPVKGLLD